MEDVDQALEPWLQRELKLDFRGCITKWRAQLTALEAGPRDDMEVSKCFWISSRCDEMNCWAFSEPLDVISSRMR